MKTLFRLIDLLLPHYCLLCSNTVRDKGNLCVECRENIPVIKTPVCSRCGYILNILCDSSELPNYLCGECRIHLPYFDKAIAPAHYRGAMKKLIGTFKYGGKPHAGRDIADIILTGWKKVLKEYSFDLIFHVPLHINKVKQRGFDQSYILAEEIGFNIGVSTSLGNLERLRQTKTQIHMNRKERKENVKGAFILRTPGILMGKKVLLVDDVYTTGATINECAGILNKAGVEGIVVVTAARA